MEVQARESNGTQIVDLIGEFPTVKDQFDDLRNKLNEVLSGEPAFLIVNINDAKRVESQHWGFLIRAIGRAKVNMDTLSVVWPYWESTIFEETSFISVYNSEEEALDARR